MIQHNINFVDISDSGNDYEEDFKVIGTRGKNRFVEWTTNRADPKSVIIFTDYLTDSINEERYGKHRHPIWYISEKAFSSLTAEGVTIV